MEEAGLDFSVRKDNLLHFTDEELERIMAGDTSLITRSRIVDTHRATTRDDNGDVMGVVGSTYGVVQNTKAFEFIDFISSVGKDSGKPMDCVIETAGALRGGAQVFISARLGEDCYLDDHRTDAVRNYVVFTNTHDGTGSVMAFITPVRIICQNTLNQAIRGAVNKLTFRHSSRVNERLNWNMEENRKKAQQMFVAENSFRKEWLDAMVNLREQAISSDYMKDFAASIYLDSHKMQDYLRNNRSLENVESISTQAKNKINGLMDSIEYGIGQDMYRGRNCGL